jgi:3-oxoacyl-[acyl-carrier protein] reductase
MKHVLVTGGSRGIGRAICLKMAGLGHYVLINYNQSEAEAQQTLHQIEDGGGSGELIKFDVSKRSEIDDILESWMERNPEKYIEILINNAGIRKDAVLVWMTDEEWMDVINTNLHGFFYLTRRLVKDMMVGKYGRIVNVVSLSGIKACAGGW